MTNDSTQKRRCTPCKQGDILTLRSLRGRLGIVRETTLAEFLNGSKNFSVCTFPEHPNNFPVIPGVKGLAKILQLIRVIKMMDYHLYSGEETVKRARSKIGTGGYNLALNNCEHFAVWCKTGVKDSSQVNNILEIIAHFLG